ncbi:ABC transporter permease [Fructobacillus fructosus]|uniref:Permease component (YadH) n=1 Tax=Fructobacillus fructosus TaxID=1631 RepID=A0ABM9N1L7_9LACO|nr:ABC transporter permease [Fructobacillus fructosus]MCK8638977.1 ABC transporter permease [Fructobacillus fructosus]CAK1248667.1 ABC-type multidrug transport system [Fructobacillus fructosus]CAK1253941.1 ABC-type multidrug transport system [Fructobacillus fructosus]
MSAIVKRNLTLYFRNRSGVFFSLMGALISFVLYIVFLKSNIKAGWSNVPNTNQLLDTWLIAGTLTIAGISTSLTSLSQMIKDKESHVDWDLSLTDVNKKGMAYAYVLSAAIVAFIMQFVLFWIMVAYFAWTDGLSMDWKVLPTTFCVMAVSSILATLVNQLLLRFVKSVDSLSKISTLVGTASGFLVGTYIPLGTLPDSAQTVMKLTPGTYIASLYRQVMMDGSLADAFGKGTSQLLDFEQKMGVRIKLTSLMSLEDTWKMVAVLILIFLLIVRRQARKSAKVTNQ